MRRGPSLNLGRVVRTPPRPRILRYFRSETRIAARPPMENVALVPRAPKRAFPLRESIITGGRLPSFWLAKDCFSSQRPVAERAEEKSEYQAPWRLYVFATACGAAELVEWVKFGPLLRYPVRP